MQKILGIKSKLEIVCYKIARVDKFERSSRDVGKASLKPVKCQN